MTGAERLYLWRMLQPKFERPKSAKHVAWKQPYVLPQPVEGIELYHQWQKCLDWHRASLKPSSIAAYEQIMRKFLVFCCQNGLTSARDVQEAHIAQWQAWLKDRQLCGTSISRARTIVRWFFGWLEHEGLVAKNPVNIRFLPKVQTSLPERVPFTYEEFQRLLVEIRRVKVVSGIPQRVHRPWWEDACVIGWHTGLRISDVACLVWPAVNFRDEVLRVRPIKRETARQVLEIPMEPELYTHLLKLWQARQESGSASDYVVPDLHGYYEYQARKLPTLFKLIVKKAGLPRHSFHSFRHGFVTRLLNAGVDPITIGSLTGQTLEMVQTYSHVSRDRKHIALAASRKALHDTRLEAAGLRPKPPNVNIAEL